MKDKELDKQALRLKYPDLFCWHGWQCLPEELAGIGVEDNSGSEFEDWCVIFTLRSGRQHIWRAKSKTEVVRAWHVCSEQWRKHRERLRKLDSGTVIRFKP